MASVEAFGRRFAFEGANRRLLFSSCNIDYLCTFNTVETNKSKLVTNSDALDYVNKFFVDYNQHYFPCHLTDEALVRSLLKYDAVLPTPSPAKLFVLRTWLLKTLGFVKNCRALTHNETLDFIVKNTTCGFGYKRCYADKREAFADVSVVDECIDCYSKLSTTSIPFLWQVKLKDELRDGERVRAGKVRTYAAPPITQHYCATRLCADFNCQIVDSWSHSPFFVGGSKFGLSFHRSTFRFRHKNFCSFDVSSFDSTIQWAFDLVLSVRSHFAPHLSSQLANLYANIYHTPLVTRTGDVFLKHGGNPSGSFNTIIDNSIALLSYYMLAYMDLHPSRPTYAGFCNDVACSIVGDDCLMSISDDIISWYNKESVVRALGAYGFQVTLEADTSSFSGQTFCSHRCTFIRDTWQLVPDEQKLLDSFCHAFKRGKNDVVMLFIRAAAFRIESFHIPKLFQFFSHVCSDILSAKRMLLEECLLSLPTYWTNGGSTPTPLVSSSLSAMQLSIEELRLLYFTPGHEFPAFLERNDFEGLAVRKSLLNFLTVTSVVGDFLRPAVSSVFEHVTDIAVPVIEKTIDLIPNEVKDLVEKGICAVTYGCNMSNNKKRSGHETKKEAVQHQAKKIAQAVTREVGREEKKLSAFSTSRFTPTKRPSKGSLRNDRGMRQQTKYGEYHLRGSELLATVSGSYAASAVIGRWVFGAGNWPKASLAAAASIFEQYDVTALAYRVVCANPTTSSGSVIAYYDSDPTDDLNSVSTGNRASAASAHRGALASPVFNSFTIKGLPKHGLYTNLASLGADKAADTRLSCSGSFNLLALHALTSFNATIYVEYTIRFRNPISQIESPISSGYGPGLNISGSITLGTGSTGYGILDSVLPASPTSSLEPQAFTNASVNSRYRYYNSPYYFGKSMAGTYFNSQAIYVPAGLPTEVTILLTGTNLVNWALSVYNGVTNSLRSFGSSGVLTSGVPTTVRICVPQACWILPVSTAGSNNLQGAFSISVNAMDWYADDVTGFAAFTLVGVAGFSSNPYLVSRTGQTLTHDPLRSSPMSTSDTSCKMIDGYVYMPAPISK